VYLKRKKLFKDTIFDNRVSVEQKEPFEYSSVLIPLNTNLELTLLVWEKIYSIKNED
tara:strand:+ start:2274 stop:2444 length:171 start_codon:yes stop_codon:yes gene_type:complete